MERVTQKDERGYYLVGDGIYSDWGVPEKFRGDDVDRLAAIEDILGDEYDLDRLREKDHHATWYDIGASGAHCSRCHYRAPQQSRYCPHCGAKMGRREKP